MLKKDPLPIDDSFKTADLYVQSLLVFVTSSEPFRTLCGGVHILDFLTKEPDLYQTILPAEWRDWFHLHDIRAVLDFLMRESIDAIRELRSDPELQRGSGQHQETCSWRGKPSPPISLLNYILDIRKHSLDRTFPVRNDNAVDRCHVLPRHVTVGMKPKKVHEV